MKRREQVHLSSSSPSWPLLPIPTPKITLQRMQEKNEVQASKAVENLLEPAQNQGHETSHGAKIDGETQKDEEEPCIKYESKNLQRVNVQKELLVTTNTSNILRHSDSSSNEPLTAACAVFLRYHRVTFHPRMG